MEFMRQHPLPDEQLQKVLEEWMIYLAEEIIEELKDQNRTNLEYREMRLREFMRQHPLPDKQLQQAFEEWIICVAKEIIKILKEKQKEKQTKISY